MRIVVALGGNALLRRDERPEAEVQLHNLQAAAPALARIADANELIIVHGNGPQVGLLARESTEDRELSRAYPLADLVAETQGLIGSWIQRELVDAGSVRPAVALVSRTLVDAADPALEAPTKFVGEQLTKSMAEHLARANGWTVAQDGTSWRRTVPSPLPIEFLDEVPVRTLLAAGCTVIAGGGGGVPVARENGTLRAIDAVIDKDLTASLIARRVGADLLVILTDVQGVLLDYGTSGQHLVKRATPESLEVQRFPAGSMGPKVAAACDFVRNTGSRCAIGALSDAEAVVQGRAGTQITATD